jgi:hypothetical protein
MIILKDQLDKKVVVFNLLKEQMDMTSMVQLGYCRDEVSILFNKLAQASFGQHIPGKRGRNGVEKFIPNELCPDTFEITFNKRPQKDSITTVEKVEPGNGVVFTETLSLQRKLPQVTSTGKAGYVVSFSICNRYILLDRLSDGGFDSIEDAVDNIWDQIKDKTTSFPCKNMNEIEQVASSLRGKGFVKLENKHE